MPTKMKTGSGGKKQPAIRDTFPTFDPNPSGKFAHDVLLAAHVDGVLIGRLAVWSWVPEESEHAFTKDLDIAVSRDALLKIRSWLNAQSITVRDLSIGGLNVTAPEGINVDFIDRASELGNLGPLFEDAVRASYESGKTVKIGGEELFLVTLEHLVAMKMSTLERKDEEDAERLLQYSPVEIDTLRRIVKTFLGPMGEIRLEALLRAVNHPQAHPRQKYNGTSSEPHNDTK